MNIGTVARMLGFSSVRSSTRVPWVFSFFARSLRHQNGRRHSTIAIVNGMRAVDAAIFFSSVIHRRCVRMTRATNPDFLNITPLLIN
jgi:hypothetical protein